MTRVLSAAQLRIVHQGAELVPAAWCERYLASIGDLLADKELTDASVRWAVETAVRTLDGACCGGRPCCSEV